MGNLYSTYTLYSFNEYRSKAPYDILGCHFCITCKSMPHSFKTGLRYPVVVSSSILNNWQGRRSENGYPGDDIHVKQLTIPGATLRSLHHAFMAEYSNCYKPFDVLLVGGLNDAMRGRSAEDIIQDIQAFKVDVLSIHRDPDAGEKSSFAAATLPFYT